MSKAIEQRMTLHDQVSPALQRMTQNTLIYKRAMRDLKREGDQLWSSIKTGVTVASAAAVGASAVMTGIGIKTNAAFETAQRSFTILLGSVDAANKMVTDLKALGLNSPFEFSGLQDAAKTLLGMGFAGNQVIPMMQSLGNAVAALGGNTDQLKGIALAIGQIRAKGKLSAEEMNQLAERGIDAWGILSKQMGKSTAELMQLGQQGKLLSSQVIPALMTGLNERFGGSMKTMSDTFEYTVANIKESVTQQLATITKPLFLAVKQDMQGLQDQFSNNNLDTWGNKFSGVLVDIYEKIKAVGSILLTVGAFRGSGSGQAIYAAPDFDFFAVIDKNQLAGIDVAIRIGAFRNAVHFRKHIIRGGSSKRQSGQNTGNSRRIIAGAIGVCSYDNV